MPGAAGQAAICGHPWLSVRLSRRLPRDNMSVTLPRGRVTDMLSLGASRAMRCQRPRGTMTAVPGVRPATSS
ncbi:putative GntR family transcriptional regulator [Streptomyces azureus]|uniref:Putative GntR family transcriptional regulator n=1 Tax=Streptomyces azureus TaxID=146537 RepID=A0A0K8PFF3_STRAJ|nr:putative GntR family transcriptional regulator [Streptomyces azureus]